MKIDFQAFLATGVPQTVLLVAGCVILAYFAIKILLKLDIPYRLAQFLEWINSKTSHYYGIILAVLAGNTLSSVRAGGVYYIFFHKALENQLIFGIPALLWTICGVATAMIFFCGYYVATHKPKKGEWLAFGLICLIFATHDFAGILVTESINSAGKSTVEINAENWAGWAFCALSLVPLLLGRWLPVLEQEKKNEETARHANFATHHHRQSQKYAIKVLAETSRKIPKENLWMFLDDKDQEYGKRILQIAAGTYKGAIASPQNAPTQPQLRNTGPILQPQLTGPMPIDAEADELPFTPIPKQKEDDFEEDRIMYPQNEEDILDEEAEVTSEDLEEESLGEATANFMKSVRGHAHNLRAMIQRH